MAAVRMQYRASGGLASGSLTLTPGIIAAVLVGDPRWQPSLKLIRQLTGYYVNVATGQYTHLGDPLAHAETREVPSYPPQWGRFPRWYWDKGTQQFIAVLSEPAPPSISYGSRSS